MKPTPTLVPYSSQTVGPYYRIGYEYMIDRVPEIEPGGQFVKIHGSVFDCDGVPIPDAVVEFWTPEAPANPDAGGYPLNYRRALTGDEGTYSTVILKPAPQKLEGGEIQAPHLLVMVFMRGLLRNLLCRVYFANDAEIASDPVLQDVPAERRGTLIAQPDGDASYHWDVVMQGKGETVFFAW